MAEREVFIGSVGPFVYEENDFYGMETNGQVHVAGAPTTDNEVLRYQDALMVSGDQTVTGKKTFDGEVELNSTLNHDGATVGLYGADPVVQASAIPPLLAGATNADIISTVNLITAALRAVGIIAT